MAGKEISLQEAADRLGVHYMTAYKYVRTGRLPARKDGVEWRVDADDVTALRRRAKPRGRGTGAPRGRAGLRLRDRLVAGDEAGAWAVVSDALSSGATPPEIYTDLLVPALRWIGDQWAAGDLSVADEHRAAVVAQRLIGRLGPRFVRPGRRRGTVIVGAPAGELHGLPGSIVADLLRAARFDVVDLGPNTPAASFVEVAEIVPRLVAVAICITTAAGEEGLAEATRALHAAGAPVVAGGAGVRDEDHARSLGATVYSGPDAADAVAAVEGLLSEPRSAGA